jgi:hypothetical protein
MVNSNIVNHAFGKTEYLNTPINLVNVFLPAKYNPTFKSLLVKLNEDSVYDSTLLKKMIATNDFGSSLNLKVSDKLFNKLSKEQKELVRKAKCRVDLICTESIFTDKVGKVKHSLNLNNIRFNNAESDTEDNIIVHDF